MLRRLAFTFAILGTLSTFATAQVQRFDFKDPKEISAVSLKIDSVLEPIVGYAKGISGDLLFDPKHPERATGTVTVDAQSVQFAHDGYTQTARGYALNSEKFPTLSLKLRKVVKVEEVAKNKFRGIVLADFTCRGITKQKRLLVQADLHPGMAEERTGGDLKGDVLVVRTHFNVNRTEHGISEGIPENLVAETVEVDVAVVGMCAKSEPEKVVEAPNTEPSKPVEMKPTEIGDRVSLGANLIPLTTRQDISTDKLQVLFFFNEQCGVTIYYKDRLRQLEKAAKAQGFDLIGIRTGRRQHPDRPLKLAEAKYLSIPFFDDVNGELMKQFRIGQSMTFAVIDREQRLRYLGGMDDQVVASQVKRHFLSDALKAVRAGKPVTRPRAQSLGCAILPIEP